MLNAPEPALCFAARDGVPLPLPPHLPSCSARGYGYAVLNDCSRCYLNFFLETAGQLLNEGNVVYGLAEQGEPHDPHQ